MSHLIIIGAGGFAREASSIAKSLNYKVLGDETYLKNIKKKSFGLHISLGFIKSPKKRVKIFNDFRKLKFSFPVIIS